MNIWNKSNLYCDGHPKPFMRGWLHVCMTFITPIVGLWQFGMFTVDEVGGKLTNDVERSSELFGKIIDNGTIYVKIPIYGYLASQTICYGVSSLYHRVNWTRSQEIFVLKLDICCIGLYEFGSYLPMYFFVLPKYSPIIAVFFGTMTFYAMMSHWYHIWVKLDPSPLRLFYVGATITPFFPILMTLLTWEEIGYMCATIVLQSAWMMVFMYKKPDPFPTIFGYHEIFHMLVVAGGFTCYAGNMSIITNNMKYSLKL